MIIDTTAGLVIGLLIFLLRFAENMMDTVFEVSVIGGFVSFRDRRRKIKGFWFGMFRRKVRFRKNK